MGMGDGKGGKENVSKEIEHEEQLEGLKNYESDQEKPEDQKDEDEKKKRLMDKKRLQKLKKKDLPRAIAETAQNSGAELLHFD